MPSGNVIRGARVGSAPMRPDERHQPAPRQDVTYWCRNDHRVDIRIAADAEAPPRWDCPRCGLPAGQDNEAPPAPPRNEPYKTHLAYVKERRSDADGEALLDEALAKLRAKRGES